MEYHSEPATTKATPRMFKPVSVVPKSQQDRQTISTWNRARHSA